MAKESSGRSIALTTTVGSIVSMCSNPFVAETGFLKGMFAHFLVGGGTTIGASAFAITGGAALGLAGASLGAVAGKKGAKIGGCVGLIVGGLGGGLWGAIDGYSTASQLLLNGANNNFKASALEQTAPAIQAPVRFSMEGNKVLATIQQPAPAPRG